MSGVESILSSGLLLSVGAKLAGSKAGASSAAAAAKVTAKTAAAAGGPSTTLLLGLILIFVLCIAFIVLCWMYLRAVETEAQAEDQLAVWQRHQHMSQYKMPRSMTKGSGSSRVSPIAPPVSKPVIATPNFEKQVAEGAVRRTVEASAAEPERRGAHLSLVTGTQPGIGIVDATIADKNVVIARYLHDQNQELQDMKRRINSLEMLMGEKMHLANKIVNGNLLKARRIARAVEGRLASLDQLLSWRDQDQTERAFVLMQSEIGVPKDAVNALLDDDVIPPLSPTLWVETLDYLIAAAEMNVKVAINF